MTRVGVKANPTSSNYQKSGQRIAPITIAIRIDPQIMDVRRDAAESTTDVRCC
jgi:hypothetical protein